MVTGASLKGTSHARPRLTGGSRIHTLQGMSDVLILGPQLKTPVLAQALSAGRMAGPIAAITAGWQEREAELASLEEHLAQPVQDLRLYARTEAVFAQDAELHDAHRARQIVLREMQDLYRLRLDHAKAAARELLWARPVTPSLRRARSAAIAALRRLDADHLRSIDAVHERFETQWRPRERPALAEHLVDLAAIVTAATTVLIAGGHVAVLLNRLKLFDAPALLRGRSIAAWSAGAMSLAERVVLFHDRPPQGAGNAEVFERGLGLVPRAVFLPHASRRLALDDAARTSLLTRRLGPATCYTLDDGDWLLFRDGALESWVGSRRLTRKGVAPVRAIAA
jgi:Peptidase family S51